MKQKTQISHLADKKYDTSSNTNLGKTNQVAKNQGPDFFGANNTSINNSDQEEEKTFQQNNIKIDMLSKSKINSAISIFTQQYKECGMLDAIIMMHADENQESKLTYRIQLIHKIGILLKLYKENIDKSKQINQSIDYLLINNDTAIWRSVTKLAQQIVINFHNYENRTIAISDNQDQANKTQDNKNMNIYYQALTILNI